MKNTNMTTSSEQRSLLSVALELIQSNMVPLLFIIVCAIGVKYSGTALPMIVSDLVNRFDRNAILVLSLIVPVICGIGMNFAIVLGAMAGQIGLIVAYILEVKGLTGILVALLTGILLSVVLGILAGKLLNRTKGQEMITGMITGYFSNGVYQFFFLFVVGGIIKVSSPLMLPSGIGIKNTVEISDLRFALGNLKVFGMDTRVDVFKALVFFGVLLAVWMLAAMLLKKRFDLRGIAKTVLGVGMVVLGLVGPGVKALQQYGLFIKVPIPTYLCIIAVCIGINAFLKTKLGQDMRAIGNDRSVASAAGIDVDRTRIIAVCISTVLASIGMVIYYQNLGIIDTYYGHEKIGTYCVAAILIGGASIKKATIGQALLGTVLFHLLFNVSPLAAQHLFSNSMVGGYFRMAICYGVIAMALVLHTMNGRRKASNGQKKC